MRPRPSGGAATNAVRKLAGVPTRGKSQAREGRSHTHTQTDRQTDRQRAGGNGKLLLSFSLSALAMGPFFSSLPFPSFSPTVPRPCLLPPDLCSSAREDERPDHSPSDDGRTPATSTVRLLLLISDGRGPQLRDLGGERTVSLE